MDVGDELVIEKTHCVFCPYGDETSVAIEESKFARLRNYVHNLMDNPSYDTWSQMMSVFVMTCILVSISFFCLETIPELERHSQLWDTSEAVIVWIFVVEYCLRLACSRTPLRFIIAFSNVIDFLAILPYFITIAQEQASGGSKDTDSFKVFRIVRLIRIFRIFKMSKYSSYMRLMGKALRRSTDALALLVFFVGIGVVIFSSIIWSFEKGELDSSSGLYLRDDGKVSPFTSIPASMYWCVMTMTTVGYGDVVPIATFGKIIACVTMISGILVIALPVTILGSNFRDIYHVYQNAQRFKMKDQIRQKSLNGMKKLSTMRISSSGKYEKEEKSLKHLVKALKRVRFAYVNRCEALQELLLEVSGDAQSLHECELEVALKEVDLQGNIKMKQRRELHKAVHGLKTKNSQESAPETIEFLWSVVNMSVITGLREIEVFAERIVVLENYSKLEVANKWNMLIKEKLKSDSDSLE